MVPDCQDLSKANTASAVSLRSFVGEPGNFVRTAGRRDFSLSPRTYNGRAGKSGIPVQRRQDRISLRVGVSPTEYRPRTTRRPLTDDRVMQTKDAPCLIFANCVDFDMLWATAITLKVTLKVCRSSMSARLRS